MQQVLPVGILSVPDSYQTRSEVFVFASAIAPVPAPRSLKSPETRPVPNLHITRRRAQGWNDPVEVLLHTLQEITPLLNRSQIGQAEPFPFDDGAVGASIRFTAEPLPGSKSVQHHIVRVDDGVATSFVASAHELEEVRLSKELLPIIRSYRST